MSLARKTCTGVEGEKETQCGNSGTEEDAISTVVSDHKRPRDPSKAYKLCYITGIRLIRMKRRTVKKLRTTSVKLAKGLREQTSVLLRKLKAFSRTTRQELTAPVCTGFEWTIHFEEEYRQAKKEGRQAQYLAACFARGFKACTNASTKAFNYAAPAAAICLLLFTISFCNNLTIALAVEYNGEQIGYVQSEADFDRAETEMKARIMYEEYVYPEDAIPRFSLTIINEDQLTSEDELTDQIIRASGNELTEGYGLYIDNRFIGATTEEGAIETMLASIKAEYATGDPTEEISFVTEPDIKEGLYPVSSILDVGDLEEEVQKDETEERTYTVQKGDAPTLIAQKYNMAYSDLKALNPDIETKLLIGQEVLIEKSVPLLGVQVTKTEVYNEETPFTITHVQDPTQLQGYTKVLQVGQKGLNEITAKVTYVDGVEESREIIETKVLKEPVEEKMAIGGKEPLQQLPASAMSSESNFIWPVDGGYVSCGFYGYYNHGGMDIASKAGTAIRAAASGTVVTATYYTTGPYGKYVVIDHGGGVKTLYAHNSAVHVQVGQWVNQGQLIASMGRTGNASGNHCHFEIIINGVRQNPANYIGTSYNR